ncbi:hypothetical protein NEPAR06_0748 [Nematocida parisii]|uniref:Uncharacterized protein n=1 Tax=Nematocida parisii (strain ERTm3) TaxID=935791 RepID=I3EJ51_NEMP3|nr:uncharacterized protein NEPG_02486 [Nematocida parisii ERTm1]EIJ89248.1 hypothetical protein NEQG_00018 [Nematocida parisii ERTm3]KAI5125618.1 hypothetical protein NEPAR03_0146 [Nematocida parisii]EIJ92598.1 hypothetical protein NEPG_02486 [Nematocida parisii ERTm1]KAI5125760.1 hypothetical protein NEPAR08_0198 [Nematocida parisii]KAI5140207.1 hypothetical protein NEPAR04_0152 [Nematocida parisii]|eukprot:XP_013060313.1 hypothetical protein NEPG_02486 [Nematocida parisii ERTm1]
MTNNLSLSQKEKEKEAEKKDNPAKPEEKDFLKIFDLVCIGDLKNLRNALCVYEISQGKVFDLKIVNKFGVYLIHSAAYYGQREVVQFLLSAVSEAEEKDMALFEAVTSDNISFESNDADNISTASSSILPVIFGHAKPSTCFINCRSLDHSATPLHYAALGGNKNNIILYLLACGADPRLRDSRGMTAQELAKEHGHKKTERIISKYVRTINQKMDLL